MERREEVVITTEDVRLALMILNEWIRQQEEVKRMLNRIRRYIRAEPAGYGFSMEDIIKWTLAEVEKRREAEREKEEIVEEKVTEEELNKLREIAKKIKGKVT